MEASNWMLFLARMPDRPALKLLLALQLDLASCLGFLSRQTSVLPPADHAGVGNTTLTWYTQTLDHFAYDEARTFQQRVFSNADHWRGPGAPILFYCGNEANVIISCAPVSNASRLRAVRSCTRGMSGPLWTVHLTTGIRRAGGRDWTHPARTVPLTPLPPTVHLQAGRVFL